MFRKANADGVVYVMAPIKYETKAMLIPFALIVVGKISAT